VLIWLEVGKLLVSAITPIAVVVLGMAINRRLKDIEQKQWRSRKLIEKRIDIYDKISPDLNALFCYYMWVGEWQKNTPSQMVDKKRELDRQVHVYRYLLPADFFGLYDKFIHLLFSTYNGAGEDARLRTLIVSGDGDRRASKYHSWDPLWEQCFDSTRTASKSEIAATYEALMQSQQRGIEITS
jgi:hypothetical protein